MTFYAFMLRYVDQRNRYGDLIDDMKRDRRFPKQSTTKDEIRSYLIRAGACGDCLETFEAAWHLYRRALRQA